MPRVTATHLVGLPQNNTWSYAGVVECAKQTSLFFVVSLVSSQATVLGPSFIDRLQSLQLDGAADLYGFLQQTVEQMTRQGAQISLALTMIGETKLVVATWRGSVILRRTGISSRLLSSANKIGILEGELSSDDVLVLCTTGASRYQTEICQRLADGFGPEVVRQAIGQEVEHDTQSASIAMTFIIPKPSPGVFTPEPASEVDLIPDTSVQPQTPDDLIIPPVVNASLPVNTESSQPDHQTKSFTLLLVPVLKILWSIPMFIGKKIAVGIKWLIKFRPAKLKQAGGLAGKTVELIRTQLTWVWEVTTGKRVYLSSARSKPRRMIMIAFVGGLVFVIIILLVWWGWSQKQAAQALAPFITARQNIESLTNSDVFQARTMAIGLRSDLTQQATASGSNNSVRQLANQELGKVDKILLDLAKKTELQELPVYLDLNTVSPGFLAELSAAGASQAALLDAGQKQQVQLNFSDQGHVLTTLDLSSMPVSLTLLSNQTPAILVDGIQAVAADGKLQKLVELGDSNREANLLASFDNTLYVFNPVKRNIFRYSKTDQGYSKPVGWLIEPLGTEFENIVSMAVDGQVWLGTNQGQVFVFKAGRAQSFAVQGLSQPLTKPIVLATNAELPNLYILDNQNARVLVIDKTSGQLQREIVSVSLKSVSNLLVTARGIFGVSGSLIYQLPD